MKPSHLSRQSATRQLLDGVRVLFSSILDGTKVPFAAGVPYAALGVVGGSSSVPASVLDTWRAVQPAKVDLKLTCSGTTESNTKLAHYDPAHGPPVAQMLMCMTLLTICQWHRCPCE
eukprot:473814-Pelagomonas_calceolata.AAC.2